MGKFGTIPKETTRNYVMYSMRIGRVIAPSNFSQINKYPQSSNNACQLVKVARLVLPAPSSVGQQLELPPMSNVCRGLRTASSVLTTYIVSEQRFIGDSFNDMFHDVPGLTHSLKCYKCGQYNEGVGSITPCINYTAHMDPKDCPPEAEWCIRKEIIPLDQSLRQTVQRDVEKLSMNSGTRGLEGLALSNGNLLRRNQSFAQIHIFGNGIIKKLELSKRIAYDRRTAFNQRARLLSWAMQLLCGGTAISAYPIFKSNYSRQSIIVCMMEIWSRPLDTLFSSAISSGDCDEIPPSGIGYPGETCEKSRIERRNPIAEFSCPDKISNEPGKFAEQSTNSRTPNRKRVTARGVRLMLQSETGLFTRKEILWQNDVIELTGTDKILQSKNTVETMVEFLVTFKEKCLEHRMENGGTMINRIPIIPIPPCHPCAIHRLQTIGANKSRYKPQDAILSGRSAALSAEEAFKRPRTAPAAPIRTDSPPSPAQMRDQQTSQFPKLYLLLDNSDTIKYVSEGSTVRDCVPTCVEKEFESLLQKLVDLLSAKTAGKEFFSKTGREISFGFAVTAASKKFLSALFEIPSSILRHKRKNPKVVESFTRDEKFE
ncbi:hypothetical protein WN51_08780 [Melipona quadrifasciata]|uniref:Uncharacterized protein n=1 Tax=Melipona quadrifasciata TaxID=166423 RepID=A0A0M8ZPR0_9HYME|nr:hypothetical protein WN51_08780 [Melipona quadrifasciata]